MVLDTFKSNKGKAPEPGDPMAKNSQKINPEIDRKIDEMIKNSPALVEKYNLMTKEQLIRKLFANLAMQNIRHERYNESVSKFIEGRPDLKEAIEKAIKNVPDDRKQAARLEMGKTALKAHKITL